MRLPEHIKKAIKSGPIPKVRNWRAIAERAPNAEALKSRLTLAERTMFFIESFLTVPEGKKVGQPLRLELFQEVFIYSIFDNPAGTSNAFLSIGRKNGKTGLIAALLIAFLIGPPSKNAVNAQLISGAMSREQAALVFNLARKMINQSELLTSYLHITGSLKQIESLKGGTLYKAISAEASTAHGLSPKVAILDEIGQVVGPYSPFVDAVTTAQGAYDDALLIIISTSAPSDADLFSIYCDDAERSSDPHTVCHVYQSPNDCELLDDTHWKDSNPALGKFRSRKDLEKQLTQAARLPAKEASVRNLLLNQRVAQENLWLAPSVWKDNNGAPDFDVFREKGVHLGLDLSSKNDLTAAVISACDDHGTVHIFPFAFTPLSGIEEKSRRDRVPYDVWHKQGLIHCPSGSTIDYEFAAIFLRDKLNELNIDVLSVQFDRWRIEEFQREAAKASFAQSAKWQPVGQGFKDVSPRMEAFETALLKKQIRHGAHPLLNMAAAGAISMADPANNKKLAKHKSSSRIDPLVAAIMAVYPCITSEPETDVSWWIA